MPACAWERKLSGRAPQRNKAAPHPDSPLFPSRLPPFPQPRGFLLYRSTQQGLPEPKGKGWWERVYFCTRARGRPSCGGQGGTSREEATSDSGPQEGVTEEVELGGGGTGA